MRTLIFALFFTACLVSIRPAHAASNSADASNAIPVTIDSIAFMEEVDTSLKLAKSGEYGRLTPGRIARMTAARNKIASLLKGHATGADIKLEDRIEVYNQHQIVLSAVRSTDKDRIVCKRVAAIGTRLAETECMTVGQREARAKLGRENLDKMRRNICFPGEGNCDVY